MEEEYDTYAYFWVNDFDCDPEEISKFLRLEPHEAFQKGDLISEKSARTRSFSSWTYRSSLPRSEPSQDEHIANLIEVMLSRKNILLELNSKYEVGINCVGYYTNVNPGFHMSADLIKSCADLGISIDFDLYSSFEPESENA